MTSTATLHQQRPGGVGDTSPTRGRPVLTPAVPLMRVRIFTATSFFRAVTVCVYILVSALLGLE
jgi:hypothetical protein